MNCKDFVINDGCNRKVVKDVSKVLPNKCVPILGLTLHVKAVVLSDRSGLVIASDHVHLIGILNFEKTQKSDNLDRMGASVDVIAEPQVTGVGQFTANLDDFEHIIKLSVNVADDGDGGREVVDILLLDEDVFEFVADEGNCFLGKNLALKSLFDQVVNVEGKTMFGKGHFAIDWLNSVY
jgi:hypothetical protein